MLSDFSFTVIKICKSNNKSELDSTNNTTRNCVQEKIKNPSWVEYLIIIWVLSLFFHEINQVNKILFKIKVYLVIVSSVNEYYLAVIY